MGLIRTNLMRNVATVLGINTVLCCVIILFSSDEFLLSPFYFAVAMTDFAVFVGWLIFASYVTWRSKILQPMDSKAYNVIEWINSGLFIYWVLSRFVRGVIGPWVIPVIAAIWLFSVIYGLSKRTGNSD